MFKQIKINIQEKNMSLLNKFLLQIYDFILYYTSPLC